MKQLFTQVFRKKKYKYSLTYVIKYLYDLVIYFFTSAFSQILLFAGFACLAQRLSPFIFFIFFSYYDESVKNCILRRRRLDFLSFAFRFVDFSHDDVDG